MAVRAGTVLGEEDEPDSGDEFRVGLVALDAVRFRVAGESGEEPVAEAAAEATRGALMPWVAVGFACRDRSRPVVRRPAAPDFVAWLAPVDASCAEAAPVSAVAIPKPADMAPMPRAVASAPTRPMKREGFAATWCGRFCGAVDVSRRLCGLMTYSLP